MTTDYKAGDRWRFTDANFVLDQARVFAGTPLELLPNETTLELKFGKAVADINRGDTNGQMDEFDLDTQTSLGEPAITDIHFQWLSQQKVSADKEIAIIKVSGTWYLMWAACEEPPGPTNP